ncbi:3830_t:CDS:2, partial [Dentiscutata erythropus]
KKIKEESFMDDVGFTVENALKDVGHIQKLAKDSGAHLPTAELLHKHLNYVKENVRDDIDWSSICGTVR